MKNNIAAIRIRKNLTQKELADKIGITNEWLCRVEVGNRGTTKMLKRIADGLDVSMKDIFLD
ncbi:helix-turn-helix transcriptional regulator [Sporosarcina sp. E16_8]|uniref:helix-turn-helix transcriptional regulator n=1 Tax=Sporosarcina sp. E16_8 TaxID=2789295 RepID=UPI001A934602|nr:helix-turn-helix transcriptional regulator [Sporosarcina sp. E16_8]MBO0586153.1 helix-turn-helix transcriptional regulator [Sporosarcina sp. E16_8]